MIPLALSSRASSLLSLPVDRRIFLEGVAGTGKTTAGVARLLRLLAAGVPADAILVLTPQRTLATPYTEALRKPGGARRRRGDDPHPRRPGAADDRAVLAAGGAPAGFAQPDRPPVFLTLETAQYFMARLVRPVARRGLFRLGRHRPQPPLQPDPRQPEQGRGRRLPARRDRRAGCKAAWVGESAQLRVYDEAQACADPLPAVLPGAQPAGLLAAVRGLRPTPLAAARLPQLPDRPLHPPDRRQHRRGHAGRPRSAGGMAARLPLGAGDLRLGGRLSPLPGRRPRRRLPAQGAVRRTRPSSPSRS